MTNDQLGILIEKYLGGAATAEEKADLEQWYHDYGDSLEVIINSHGGSTEAELRDKMLHRLRATLYPVAEVKVLPLWRRPVAAAAVVAFLSIVAWYLLKTDTGSTDMVATESVISPGFEQAILIKSDGSKIELGRNSLEKINEKNGIVIQNDGRQLSYQPSSADKISYNTLEVPRKGIYSIVLADGTKVWVNSLSSLKYPMAFPGKERRVFVKGEAYFEVAKNAKQPFIVEVEGKEEIDVLGTKFNVNAYENEQVIRTTLLEGAVRVMTGKAAEKLAPMEEASVDPAQSTIRVAKIEEAGDAAGWKDGFFVCNGKDLQAILRQVTRWYDIEVKYQGNMPSESFAGAIPRNMNLSEVLKVLEITGVHFSLQGKTLTVLP